MDGRHFAAPSPWPCSPAMPTASDDIHEHERRIVALLRDPAETHVWLNAFTAEACSYEYADRLVTLFRQSQLIWQGSLVPEYIDEDCRELFEPWSELEIGVEYFQSHSDDVDELLQDMLIVILNVINWGTGTNLATFHTEDNTRLFRKAVGGSVNPYL